MNQCQNKNCNKQTNNPRFCSRSCSAIVTGTESPKRKRTKTCKICNILIRSEKTFCSYNCYSKGRSKRKAIKPVGYERLKNFRTRLKQQSVDYKGGKCSLCGYNKCIKALEFHHTDPNQKDFVISGISKAFESIKYELDKCILVCANCHREIHDSALTS